MTKPNLQITQFTTLQPYEPIFAAMRRFTENRTKNDADQLWLLQHHAVLTQGQAGKAVHILANPDKLPIVQTDRGGQVTWHGPGQLVGYLLCDLNRLHWHVRDLVSFTEQLLIELLAGYGLQASSLPHAPGVYIGGKKIASLGFKIRKGCSYHGFSLNIDCELNGFLSINPCGYAGLQMIRLKDVMPSPPSLLQTMQHIGHRIQQKQVFNQIALDTV